MVGTRNNPDVPEEDAVPNPGADNDGTLAALQAQLSEERDQRSRLEERFVEGQQPAGSQATSAPVGGASVPSGTNLSTGDARPRRSAVKLTFPRTESLSRTKVHLSLHFIKSLTDFYQLDCTPEEHKLITLTTQIDPVSEFGKWFLSEDWASFDAFVAEFKRAWGASPLLVTTLVQNWHTYRMRKGDTVHEWCANLLGLF